MTIRSLEIDWIGATAQVGSLRLASGVSYQRRYFRKQKPLDFFPVERDQHVRHRIFFGVFKKRQGFQNMEFVVSGLSVLSVEELDAFTLACPDCSVQSQTERIQ